MLYLDRVALIFLPVRLPARVNLEGGCLPLRLPILLPLRMIDLVRFAPILLPLRMPAWLWASASTLEDCWLPLGAGKDHALGAGNLQHHTQISSRQSRWEVLRSPVAGQHLKLRLEAPAAMPS